MHPSCLSSYCGSGLPKLMNEVAAEWESGGKHNPAQPVIADGPRLVYSSHLGHLYGGDCGPFLEEWPTDTVDMVFADPPFNLAKKYGEGINDDRPTQEYLDWSRQWLAECVRVLKPGGSLFVFNLPRWLIETGAFLNSSGMMFRHWIACRMPKAFPRKQRLSPAHYGLLYYSKGPPTVFNRIYVPIPLCRHCGGEVRDYGGHRNQLNPNGLNLMDVLDDPTEVWQVTSQGETPAEDLWDDIYPVRHSRHKTRPTNELAPLLLERLIQMTTHRGDLVLDPFGGSGTTFFAAERLGRYWVGIELGDTAPAIRRLTALTEGYDSLPQGKNPKSAYHQQTLFAAEPNGSDPLGVSPRPK